MNADYDGVEVMDSKGTSVGKVERTYVDDAGTPRYVEVKFGTLLPKHRLDPGERSGTKGRRPVAGPIRQGDDRRLARCADAEALEPADLQQIDSYYRGDEAGEGSPAGEESAVSTGRSSQDDAGSDGGEASRNQFEVVDESAGGLRVGDQVPAGMNAPVIDRGDVVEVPVLEEILVKKTVVREILRVKKSDVVEQETVDGDVRKETLEVDDPSGAVSDTNVAAPSN